MSADTHELIQQSLQGDQRAFGQIVERYQGAVSAMAYSVTGNLAQSEDLAQEAFIIAWKKLGALQKHESLSAWLCGIARNLARDWMRTQAVRPTVSMEHLDESAQPSGESNATTQLRQERADLVWSALAEIPENYREPLILFYRQGESIRDIAEALELTEDNVKQRLSRGRKLLRAEVARTVEDTLADTRPGKKFTAGVIAALPALYAAKAGAAELTTTSAKAVAAPAAMGALMKITLPIAVVVAVVLGGLGWQFALPPENTTGAPKSTSPTQAERGNSEGNSAVLEAGAITDRPADASNADTTVSGIVVFRDSGAPATNMRVVCFDNEKMLGETVSDQQGHFTLRDSAAGEFSLLAYDAEHSEVPVDDYRSAIYPISIIQGDSKPDIRIEVPSLGKVHGRVLDAKTGEGIAGIKVHIFRYGEGDSSDGISDAEGKYVALGVEAGYWLVSLDRNNPILSSRDSKDLVTVVVEKETSAALDIKVDRGLSFSGRVVDSEGNPVANADIEASLAGPFPERDSIGNSSLKSGADGTFTLWGVQQRDLVQLVASLQDLKSYAVVVSPNEQGHIESPLLTLSPQTKISGRFVDESGRAIHALAGYRYNVPEVPGSWHYGNNVPAATFQISVPPGEYELMGRNRLEGMRTTGLPQTLHVGTDPIANLVLTVPTPKESNNPDGYTLTGQVVTSDRSPVSHFSLTLSSKFQENAGMSTQSQTFADGTFVFENLPGSTCSIWAVPSDEFYLPGSVSNIDPAISKSVEIVVMRAATLRGLVVDTRTGEPVTNFGVERGTIDSFGARQRMGVSKIVHSEHGEFSVPGKVDTNWFLQVSADGFAPLELTGTPLKSGEESEVLAFKLLPGRVVQGSVTTENGEPIPDARVSLDHETVGRSSRNLDASKVKTDDAGHFEFSSIPDDAEWVYAGKEGFAMARVPLTDEVHIVLGEGGIVEGRVTIGGVVPESPVTVKAIAPGTGEAVATTTAPDGTYQLTGLTELAFILCVDNDYPTVYFLEEIVTLQNGVSVTANLDIPSGDAVVYGVVSDANGAPLSMPIQCTVDGISKQSQADENGNYRIDALPAGPASVAIRVPDYDAKGEWFIRALSENEVVLESGTETEHNIVYAP